MPSPAEDTSSTPSEVSEATARADAQEHSGSPEKAPNAAPDDGQADQGPRWREAPAWFRAVVRQTPSWLVSMLVHMVLLLALALLTLPAEVTDELRQLVIAPDKNQQLDDLEDLDYEPPTQIDVSADLAVVETAIEQTDFDVSVAEDVEAAAAAMELQDLGTEGPPRGELLTVVDMGNGLSGRGEGTRVRLLREAGGTPASEGAVSSGLKWLAEHQLYDGGWNFNHPAAPSCHGQCRNPGALRDDTRIGATGMALLPFLGAGQTHRSGKYKATVNSGLAFLIAKMNNAPQGGSLWDLGGRMYSHGLGSIALSEAYAMTHDRSLRKHAQDAIDYVCFAQDPVGGGWRYNPRQRGDTSVVGWQIMALKSGHMAYLRVPRDTAGRASRFLDSVQCEGGAGYGYLDSKKGDATTAVGLLCRMYLGWKRDNEALQRGVEWLSEKGPSEGDMYFNYYATQVMRHWEGDLWQKWNNVMREQLIASQAKDGHEKGSWFFPRGDLGADAGGRLYCTSMATMVLEVYYRHLPLYRKQSTEEDFPE